MGGNACKMEGNECGTKACCSEAKTDYPEKQDPMAESTEEQMNVISVSVSDESPSKRPDGEAGNDQVPQSPTRRLTTGNAWIEPAAPRMPPGTLQHIEMDEVEEIPPLELHEQAPHEKTERQQEQPPPKEEENPSWQGELWQEAANEQTQALKPAGGESGFNCLTVVLGLLGFILYLAAVVPLILAMTSDVGNILVAVAIACGFLCGVGSLSSRRGVCCGLSTVLGVILVAVVIVFFFLGGFKGMYLYTNPNLLDCDIDDLRGDFQSFAQPAIFMCREGFLDTSKQVTAKINGANLKMAPVYFDQDSSEAAPTLFAVTEGSQEPQWASDWGPCGQLDHSHEHIHDEDPSSMLHSHKHTHYRMCGFAFNVRQSVAWSDIAVELRPALRKQHVDAGGTDFDVDSVPLVDLGDPAALSLQLKTFFIVGIAGYALLLPGFCFCCVRSLIMVTHKRDCMAS